jgi:hypothetical protein
VEAAEGAAGKRHLPPQTFTIPASDQYLESAVETGARPTSTTTPLFECRTLNVVCYRSTGPIARQIIVYRPQPTNDSQPELETYRSQITDHFNTLDPLIREASSQTPITTNQEFMSALNHAYYRGLCQPWRRWFSLKSLRALRLRSYAEHSSVPPAIEDVDPMLMQEFLRFVTRPELLREPEVKGVEEGEETKMAYQRGVWIHWVFTIRTELEDGRVERKLVEFVEGWDAKRIVMASSVPLAGSVVVGLTWAIMWGDAQTAFTVASFILTFGAAMIALLGVVSSSSGI